MSLFFFFALVYLPIHGGDAVNTAPAWRIRAIIAAFASGDVALPYHVFSVVIISCECRELFWYILIYLAMPLKKQIKVGSIVGVA